MVVEGQGIVVVEALVSGTPVAAYDLPAYKGVLVDGVNAGVAWNGDVEWLAKKCLEVLGNYDYYRKNSGVNLDEFSEENFEKSLSFIL